MDPSGDASSDSIDIVWRKFSYETGATNQYYRAVDSLTSFCNGAEASEQTFENVKDSIIKKENICYLKDGLEKNKYIINL